MMKFRPGIIYIQILVLLVTSFGVTNLGLESAAFAEQSEEHILPPSQINLQRLEATENALATEGVATFHIPESVKKSLDEELEKQPVPVTEEIIDKAVKKISPDYKKSYWTIFQATFAPIIITRIAEASQKAHNKNLMITAENEKIFTDQLGDPIEYRQIPALVLGASANLGINSGLAYIYKGFKKKIFNLEGTDMLFKYLVSGSLLSIGSKYIETFVDTAAKEVLDHPNQFGGLTNDERGALKLLQYRNGFAYFLTALSPITKVGISPAEKHKLEAFHQIAWKVEAAMSLILLHDDDLRNALWTHLYSQAFLQGGHLVNIGLAFLTEQTVKLVSDDGGYWSKNIKFMGIAIGVGLIGAAIPNQARDWGTGQANSIWASGQKLARYHFLNSDLSNPANSSRKAQGAIIENFLDLERESRQSRFIKYAYLMKLAIDNMDNLTVEAQQIDNIDKGIVALQAPQTIKENLKHYFSQFISFDFLISNKSRSDSDKSGIEFYKNFFAKAANGILKIYSADLELIDELRRRDLPTDTIRRLNIEYNRVGEMGEFTDHLVTTLSDRWDKSKPRSPQFEINRHVLEQISLWGVHESQIVSTLNDDTLVRR